jgi:hypothetical protein
MPAGIVGPAGAASGAAGRSSAHDRQPALVTASRPASVVPVPILDNVRQGPRAMPEL